MSKIYVFKHCPPTPPSPFLGPRTFALNSHTYNPLFEKILDPPLRPGIILVLIQYIDPNSIVV